MSKKIVDGLILWLNNIMIRKGESLMTQSVLSDVEIEKIAKAVHETWMQNRIKDGWTYGAERSDTARTSPCIVPYENLPESEKEYDRNTTISVVQALYKLNYSIKRKK